MKKIVSLIAVYLLLINSTLIPIHACTVGVVAGKASADGRPMAWKNRDASGETAQAVHFGSGGTFPYIGVGDCTGTAFMGLNSEGLAMGNSVTDNGEEDTRENQSCQQYLLKTYSTVDQCLTAIKEGQSSCNSINFTLPLIGKDGKAMHVEKRTSYYEYDPLNCGPDKVRKYAVIARANTSHINADGNDNATTGGPGPQRYVFARDHMHNAVIRNGILNTDSMGGLGVTVDEMMLVSRFGNPPHEGSYTTGGNCNSITQGAIIAQGIKNGDNPKIAVMWAALINPDYIPYIPVWVEIGVKNQIPSRISTGSVTEDKLSYQARRLYAAGKKDSKDYDQYVFARIKPMEANIVQAVTDARTRWASQGFVYEEALRICREACETSYWTVKTLADKAQTAPRDLNRTPLCTSIQANGTGTTVAFSHNASDSDGTISSCYWEFGDGDTSVQTSPSHTYASNGTYLVMCRVTDNGGSRNSLWKYVTVGSVNLSASRIPSIKTSEILSISHEKGKVCFLMQLNSPGEYIITVYTVKGQNVWSYSGNGKNAGYFRINWDNYYSSGKNVYVAMLMHNGKRSFCKIIPVADAGIRIQTR
jgi:hypothetical protein